MKIIDLLNKIANGEEVPKKIKYNDYIYIAKGNAIENFVDYSSEEDEWCFNHYVRYENLNDEVEILDNENEEKKIPEKIEIYEDEDEECSYFIDNHCKKIYINCDEVNFIIEEFNQLIDYLKSKGE